VRPKAGLDAVVKNKNPFPVPPRNRGGRSARSPVTILTDIFRLPQMTNGLFLMLGGPQVEAELSLTFRPFISAVSIR
jgi:hypothetical protein